MNQVQTLSQLRENQLAPKETSLPQVQMGFGSQQGFELMQRGAKLLAASTLVPKEYQGNISNCSIALNMATRLGADPLLVMQNLYIVHNRPGWSAKFLIASFNQCGRFSAIRYEKQGQRGQKDWGCRAFAIEKATGERIEGPWITWGMVEAEGWSKRNGSKWLTIPDLMFMYRAAAWMVNSHAPEISMGLSTAEELQDVFDAERDAEGNYSVTLDSLREAAPEIAGEIIDTATGEVVTESHGNSLSVGDIKASLESSKNIDELNEAADLIRTLPEDKRADLNTLYDELAAKLQ